MLQWKCDTKQFKKQMNTLLSNTNAKAHSAGNEFPGSYINRLLWNRTAITYGHIWDVTCAIKCNKILWHDQKMQHHHWNVWHNIKSCGSWYVSNTVVAVQWQTMVAAVFSLNFSRLLMRYWPIDATSEMTSTNISLWRRSKAKLCLHSLYKPGVNTKSPLELLTKT